MRGKRDIQVFRCPLDTQVNPPGADLGLAFDVDFGLGPIRVDEIDNAFCHLEGLFLKGDGSLLDLGPSADNGLGQTAPDFKIRTDLKLGQVVLDHERLPMADGDVQIDPLEIGNGNGFGCRRDGPLAAGRQLEQVDLYIFVVDTL